MRHERKYKIDPLHLPVVHEVLRQHPGSFRTIFPDRQINNIYFDTPGLTAYKDNVMGIAERKKYRVRWYGDDPLEVQQPVLEVKIKNNELGWKESQQMEGFDWNNLMELARRVGRMTKKMEPLQPVLMNAYRRSYYGTANGQYRITIDHQLRFFSLLQARRFTRFQISEPVVIVELKYAAELDEAAEEIRQYIPFRQTKSSKYVTGVDLFA
ncbi:MAG: polyphosphate polymerase domain-containing protein [Bacteroidota bacterium]